jgi:hypothetical protein
MGLNRGLVIELLVIAFATLLALRFTPLSFLPFIGCRLSDNANGRRQAAFQLLGLLATTYPTSWIS